jgi:hypothetical protein
MPTVSDIAALIVARRQELDRLMGRDLVTLQVRYGEKALTEAIKLADRAAAQGKLSIVGERQRRHERRQADHEAQRLFARKD